jgi:hypothetical protein
MPKILRVSFPEEQDIASVEMPDDDYAELADAVARRLQADPSSELTPARLVVQIGLKVMADWATKQRTVREATHRTRIAALLERFDTTAEKELFVQTVEALAPAPAPPEE